MERYVWELTRELRDLGHEVEVLCEVCLAEKPQGIQVYELGTIALRPRWISLLRFSRRVSRWLDSHSRPGWRVHSHERLSSHHITTFHGPPFATVFEKPWWRMISLRVVMQLYLERRELRCAQYIVPNSPFISKQLAHYYPDQAHKLTSPILPGVKPGSLREYRAVPRDGGVIGFVGKEWRRKGLPFAVEVVALLRRSRPELKLLVVGPDVNEVEDLFDGWHGGYQLAGWSDQAYYAQFDVLLHPARAEPYGMVISEAMAACVPVVVSDVCGAAVHVTDESGAVLPLSATAHTWADAIEQQLTRRTAVKPFTRSWTEVAEEYVTRYRQLDVREAS
jgi:UDP-glucose:(heptosyl)LPS alpha-1,3-glucosyltransferase